MRWSERQAALLAEMGIRLWPAPASARSTEPAAGPGATPAVDDSAVALADPAEPAAQPVAARPPSAATPPADGFVADGFADEAGSLVTVLPVSNAPPIASPAGGATAVDVRALDWPALRAAVAGCTACTLCRSRTQTVFGVGHPRAHWMIVGEAPGEQEDLQGEPFVGRSGQLLDNMLSAIGLSRGSALPGEADTADPAHHVYIANTLKCRPPGNRNPAPDELARCEGYLIRQIELVQPRMILAMGRFAVQSLLRSSEPIGRLRGRVHRYHGVPLVVTYHPAYLLRSLPEKARAWDDLCLALDALKAAA